MSERSFRFKPIETRYKGYRFRSRLEARWAVFFDELGIEYQYEPEGYALDGIPYLPDFWLPKQKIFFEVKGEEPTPQEIEKAMRLSLYTEKLVYIASGSISLPPDDICNLITVVSAPYLVKVRDVFDSVGNRIDTTHEYPDVPSEIALLLQRLNEADIQAKLLDGKLALSSTTLYWEFLGLDYEKFKESIRKQIIVLEQVETLFHKHKEELAKALITEPGWEIKFQETIVSEGPEWLECSACGELDLLASVGFPHEECPQGKGKWRSETPRLIAAYTAAREARFK